MTKYTKIHDKYYDLTKFKHPGGDTAIWEAYGRDATTLFESYHPFINKEKMKLILKKYEIDDPGNIESGIEFDYDTEFSRELIQEVGNYFKDKSVYWSNDRKKLILILSLLKIFGLYFHFSGYYIACIIEPFFSWLFGVNTFHDACHFSLSKNKTINKIFSYLSPELSQPYDWYYQHNIGHHVHTNIKDKDPDLYHRSNIRLTKKIKYKNIYKNQILKIPLIWSFTYIGLLFIFPFELHINKLYNNCVKVYNKQSNNELILYISMKIYFILAYIIYPYTQYNFLYATGYVLISRILLSLLFMINAELTHIHEECMNIDDDWYKHQVKTAYNHSIGSKITTFFSGGLNYQIEHHLFPGVNHCHHKN